MHYVQLYLVLHLLLLDYVDIQQKVLLSTLVVDGSTKSLYDKVQIDSETVEKEFVENKLNKDPKMEVYFKFPRKFEIKIPRIIRNCNPDWGVVRKDENDTEVQLVRETKPHNQANLHYLHDKERHKIKCAMKYFKEIGIPYKVINGKETDWMDN